MTPKHEEIHDLSLPQVRQACRAALLEVLETMFFELPAADLEVVDAPEVSSCLIRAGFHGSANGAMQLAISCRICCRLAASFLGKETDEVSLPEKCSTARELANMLCGASLSRLKPHGRMTIETPQSIEAPAADSGPWLRYPLEGGFIDVALRYGEGL
ncbi:chemotaxis protein CheX [Paludibaculum fermentans]|uniref:Chemotaxis protein CheX n=1 Tax=Paludibaculum fermentans TaxID=1473598 RepID=A0A7S7NRS8_PALFE|nr:chemotaxis protein CheX [Paludibaculum fermentans]QOY88655.1 chemotaxis protein CheX [Paludibaculum fermentans]